MIRRREFIAGIGVAAWPLVARTQQAQVPRVGHLNSGSPQDPATAAFLEGLAEAGFIDGRNVRFIYRYAENRAQMPALAAELVRLQPAVIAANTTAAALAAKAATSTIPIVFGTGDDPVEVGLVASLNAPGGNATGATGLQVELEGKRLELMDQIVPAGQTVAALLDTKNPAAERQSKNIQEVADLLGRKVRILHATTEREIDMAFAALQRPPAAPMPEVAIASALRACPSHRKSFGAASLSEGASGSTQEACRRTSSSSR
jgi:putative tryptophan/tyrosine transport system substrate-binding protein